MNEEIRNETSEGENKAEMSGDARKTRGIRFSESEWEEVKRAAAAHQMPVAEFIREQILALARTPESAAVGPVGDSMAPLIERVFRYTWILATEKRDAMIREGREDEIENLVAEARAFHESLRSGIAPSTERAPKGLERDLALKRRSSASSEEHPVRERTP